MATERLTVMQVATRLHLTYPTARNRMLKGEFGAPEYRGRILTVPLAGVMQYQQRVFEAKQRAKTKR